MCDWQTAGMTTRMLLLASATLVGCASFENPQGNCQLPDRLKQANGTQWVAQGERIFKTARECAALAGVYEAPAIEVSQARTQVAAELGNTDAMLQLGQWALNSQPVRADEAYEAFLSAYRYGDLRGAWHIAELYAQGIGRPVNTLEALNWYQKTADGPQLVTRHQWQAEQLKVLNLTQKNQQLQADNAWAQSQLSAVKTQLADFKDSRLASLYRLDEGTCGATLDWQAFGEDLHGLSSALQAFDAQYQGWLWLSPIDVEDYLLVYQSFIQVATKPVVMSPAVASKLNLGLANQYVVTDALEDGAIWQGTPVSWCLDE